MRAGKTNFVQVFELLNDVSSDFHDAIRKHGGSFVKNFNLFENNSESCIEVKFSNISQNVKLGSNKNILLLFNNIDYVICFNFGNDESKVKNEFVKLNCNVKYGDNG